MGAVALDGPGHPGDIPSQCTRCICWLPSTPADVRSWVTAGNAMNTLAGKGISVWHRPVGAYSMYQLGAGWRQTVGHLLVPLRLPDWLAANRGLAPGGHAAVGAAQGGYGAMAGGATDRLRWLDVGLLYPSNTTTNGAIAAGMQQFIGHQRNVGAPREGAGSVEVATRGCMPACWRKTTPRCGCGADQPEIQRSRPP